METNFGERRIQTLQGKRGDGEEDGWFQNPCKGGLPKAILCIPLSLKRAKPQHPIYIQQCMVGTGDAEMKSNDE